MEIQPMNSKTALLCLFICVTGSFILSPLNHLSGVKDSIASPSEITADSTDLSVNSITVTPKEPMENELFIIDVKAQKEGKIIPKFFCDLYVKGELKSRISREIQNKSGNVPFDVFFMLKENTSGSYEVKVFIDSLDNITESNESNNVITIEVKVIRIELGNGILEIDTQPIKGEVFVDGKFYGIAPQCVEVSACEHRVTFGEVEGYSSPNFIFITAESGERKQVLGIYKIIKKNSSFSFELNKNWTYVFDSLEISGNLCSGMSGLEGREFHLILTKPNNDIKPINLQTDSTGRFQKIIHPDSAGNWSIVISWDGDESYEKAISQERTFEVLKRPSNITIGTNEISIRIDQKIMIMGKVNPPRDTYIFVQLNHQGENGIIWTAIYIIESMENGTFSKDYEPLCDGSWSVQAISKEDNEYFRAESNIITFSVSVINWLESLPRDLFLIVIGAIVSIIISKARAIVKAMVSFVKEPKKYLQSSLGKQIENIKKRFKKSEKKRGKAGTTKHL